ncbi:40S ribosomal protein S9, putative, partial [Rhizoctonia solani AG-3 Rhs1AP]
MDTMVTPWFVDLSVLVCLTKPACVSTYWVDNRRLLRAQVTDPGVQVWTRQVDPPCACHIRVGKQIVSVPSFVVRHDPQNHIDFARTSLDGRGRVYRKRAAAVANKDGGGDDEDE